MRYWFRRRFARLENLRAKYLELDAFLDYLERAERRQTLGQFLLTTISLVAGWLLSSFVSPAMLVHLLAR